MAYGVTCMATNTELKSRYDVLKGRRTNLESTWDLIEKFVVPFRSTMWRDHKNEESIEWRNRELFDSTAPMSCQSLAASLHGSTTPMAQWFALSFRDKNMNQLTAAKSWLEEVTTRMWFEIQESDFNLEVNEVYLDLTSFGTAILIEEAALSEDGEWEGLDFSSVPAREIYFEQDHKGRVLNFYRKLEWSPLQMISKFGEEGVPQDVREKAKSAQSAEQKEELFFCIFKRKASNSKTDPALPLAHSAMPYGYRYIRVKDSATLGEEGGYYEMPAYIPRWQKTSGSQWGNSPAMIALPDILTINQLVELILRSAEKVIDPPTLTEQRTLLSDLDLEPSGWTVVRDINKIRPYESGARFDVSQLQREELVKSIRSYFHIDQLELKESPTMTATEVQVRYELMQRLLGPTLGRIQTDLLDPMIQRTFKIMMRAGRLPPIPEELAGADMDIEYTGPLPRAQKLDAVASIERFTDLVGRIAQVNPDIVELPDWDNVLRKGGDDLGVPADFTKDKAQVARERQAKQAALAEQRKAESAQSAGDAMKSVGEGQAAMAAAGGAEMPMPAEGETA